LLTTAARAAAPPDFPSKGVSEADLGPHYLHICRAVTHMLALGQSRQTESNRTRPSEKLKFGKLKAEIRLKSKGKAE
jgi:hypothetical protein